jgi:uncharacterized protein
MKVSGEATLHAPIDKVWSALNDPAVLVRTIPGCERLEATGPDSYRMVVTAGVSSIKGTYSGDVSLRDKKEPESFLMTAAGAGGPGTVNTEVRVTLADSGNGSTQLAYDADAVVGGMVAGVGQRMLASVGKKMAGQFFAAVDDVLTGAAVESAPAAGMPASAPAMAAPASADAAQATAGGVFVAPDRPLTRGGPGFGRGVIAGRAGFREGVLLGAGVALAGVVVGGLLGRRHR